MTGLSPTVRMKNEPGDLRVFSVVRGQFRVRLRNIAAMIA